MEETMKYTSTVTVFLRLPEVGRYAIGQILVPMGFQVTKKSIGPYQLTVNQNGHNFSVYLNNSRFKLVNGEYTETVTIHLHSPQFQPINLVKRDSCFYALQNLEEKLRRILKTVPNFRITIFDDQDPTKLVCLLDEELQVTYPKERSEVT